MRDMDKNEYENSFLDELDELRYSILDEIWRPSFPLEGERLSKDGTAILLKSNDMYECYNYWLKFLLLRPLSFEYEKLNIKHLGPKSLALLTTYVSLKLQEEIKKQINDGLLEKLVLGFVNDEDVKKILAKDASLKENP